MYSQTERASKRPLQACSRKQNGDSKLIPEKFKVLRSWKLQLTVLNLRIILEN